MEPKLSDAGAGGGEDRLSVLPDDLLVHILLKLRNAPAAARTSVLARRWRRVWAPLPELHFPRGTHPDGIPAALTAHDAPALGHLFVTTTTEVTLESVAAWLTIAARRLSGVLSFQISKRWNMAGERCALKLPCFEKATKVGLTLSSNGLVLPPSGVFTLLADLELFHITLHGPCTLGDLVSSPRCPSLRRLCVYGATGLLDKLIIHSKSLLQLELNDLPSLELLDVVTLALQDLVVNSCFSDHSRPVATISAPQLVTLDWSSDYNPSVIRFGDMTHLQQLSPHQLVVHGHDVFSQDHRDWSMLLNHFDHVSILNLKLYYLPGQIVCQSGCSCVEPSNWETKELVLRCLKEIEIDGFIGTEHELALVRRLFKWTTMLKRMTVHFNDSVTQSKGKELCQLLLSFSRPEICMKFLH